MNNLLETLKQFQKTIDYVIHYGRCFDPTSEVVEHKKFSFEEISRIGTFSVGICRWSARGEHDPSACVIYLAVPEKVMWVNNLISPLIFKEYWPVTTSESELWLEREVRRPVGPPRSNWWQRQKYAVTLVPERIPGTYTLEEAVMTARLRAEELHGITLDQQKQINMAAKEIQIRDEAMRELDIALA